MFELLSTPESLFQEIKPRSFVLEWRNCLDPKDCARMIEQFEESTEDHASGKVAWGIERPELKRSTDLYMRGQSEWDWADQLLHDKLMTTVAEMKKEFSMFGEDALEDTGYQIQRTLPGEFYHWHKDANRHSRKRVLVFIWYLNDMPVDAGGATEFKFQQVKVQPEVGKMIVFPPYWTHLHRGCEVLYGKKYICTGWISYQGAYDDYIAT